VILAALVVVMAIVVTVIANERHPAPSTDLVPSTDSAPSAHFAARQIWLVGANAIAEMRNAGASQQLIDRAFNNRRTYVYGDTYANHDVPSAIGIPTIYFASYQAIRQAFADGTLPGRFRAVIYDNEHWPKTPLAEQRSPTYYETLVARLLHRHGLIYIATPTPGLTWASRSKNSAHAYMRAADTARYSGIFDIQAQQIETNLPKFFLFASAAAKQAHRANPHIKVLVGIRTNSGDAALYAAYKAASHIGDGCWLNVNGIPAPAVHLLRRVYHMR
jgi:hypothetical protein